MPPALSCHADERLARPLSATRTLRTLRCRRCLSCDVADLAPENNLDMLNLQDGMVTQKRRAAAFVLHHMDSSSGLHMRRQAAETPCVV